MVTRVFLGRLAIAASSLGVAACSTEYAETAGYPDADAGAAGADGSAGSGGSAGSAGSAACPVSLDDRLSVSRLSVDADIRYKRQGYDLVPIDERIALAVSTSGEMWVAWLENAGRNVHVTPLDANGERRGGDVVLPGYDVGGLVAHDDGFALLTRRDDPGEPLRDPNHDEIAPAAVLVRVVDGDERFAAALTGTSSVVPDVPADRQRDCASVGLSGRLAFNGEKYGAYFHVHGCEGHPNASYYGDKLVYVDGDGEAVSGGWDWGCSINQGLRLLPTAGSFTSLCFSDRLPSPGLNWISEQGSLPLAIEYTTGGYSGGQFGSVLELADGGHFVAWLTRGVREVDGRLEPEKDLSDITIQWFDPEFGATGPRWWLFESPNILETNLHVTPYGNDGLLVVWDSVEDFDFCDGETCFGTYTGTHARLTDPGGIFTSPDTLIEAPPSSNDDIVVLPNGDLVWAFVPDPDRSYETRLNLDADGVPIAPPRREIGVARLRYCR